MASFSMIAPVASEWALRCAGCVTPTAVHPLAAHNRAARPTDKPFLEPRKLNQNPRTHKKALQRLAP
jgi:hypothetical protein